MITANCVIGGTYFDILLGGGNTELSTDIAWVHPGYNETTFVDNIALLELSEPVEFTENIAAAAMPDAGQVVEEGDLLTVCLYESFDSMVCLENVPVLGEEECSLLYPQPHLLPPVLTRELPGEHSMFGCKTLYDITIGI